MTTPSLDLETGEYNEAKETGQARRYIAYALIVILAVVILLAFAALLWALDAGKGATARNIEHLVTLMNIVFGPVVTLVGSATG